MKLLCSTSPAALGCALSAKYLVFLGSKNEIPKIERHEPTSSTNLFEYITISTAGQLSEDDTSTLPQLTIDENETIRYSLQILTHFMQTWNPNYSNFTQAEIMQWLTFANDKKYQLSASSALQVLEGHLEPRTYFVNEELSIADLILFTSLHSWMAAANAATRSTYSNISRWFDHVQHQDGIQHSIKELPLVQDVTRRAEPFMHLCTPPIPAKTAGASNGDENQTQSTVKKETKKEKKKENKPAVKKENTGTPQKPLDHVARLEVRVGLIKSVRKHPEGDMLFVEEIDIGETNCRTICSGIVGFIAEEELINHKCLVAANLKARKLKGVESHGMILCAETHDRSKVELLFPPEDTPVGELITWKGYDGPPDAVLNTKTGKNPFVEIQPHFKTSEECIAQFKGISFMTSCGPCRCKSITGGKIL